MDRLRRFMNSPETKKFRLVMTVIIFLVSFGSSFYVVERFQPGTYKFFAAFPVAVACWSGYYFCGVVFRDVNDDVMVVKIKARPCRGFNDRMKLSYCKSVLEGIVECSETSSPTSQLSPLSNISMDPAVPGCSNDSAQFRSVLGSNTEMDGEAVERAMPEPGQCSTERKDPKSSTGSTPSDAALTEDRDEPRTKSADIEIQLT